MILYGNTRRIVIYPCRNNTELNFVCLHLDEESGINSDDWNQAVSKDLVLKVFDEYTDDVKALLAMMDPDGVKLWKLLDLPALDTVSLAEFTLGQGVNKLSVGEREGRFVRRCRSSVSTTSRTGWCSGNGRWCSFRSIISFWNYNF